MMKVNISLNLIKIFWP